LILKNKGLTGKTVGDSIGCMNYSLEINNYQLDIIVLGLKRLVLNWEDLKLSKNDNLQKKNVQRLLDIITPIK